MNIEYGISMTPFGSVLIARSKKGITDILFTDNHILAEAKLLARWQNIPITRNDKELAKLSHKIFYEHKTPPEIKLDLIGTDFQIKVWEALLKVKMGETTNYSDISEIIGHPNALRAVGTAVGKNPVQYLVPCHRVIKRDGTLGEYAAGLKLKKLILTSEGVKIK